jgi:hypothetical protein
VGGCVRDDRFGLAEFGVHLVEALKEAGQGARTDGDMGSHLHVALTSFAGDDAELLLWWPDLRPREDPRATIHRSAGEFPGCLPP